MVEVQHVRIENTPKCCVGSWVLEGKELCKTLEDTDRMLVSDMPLGELQRRKVAGRTAIPTGKYLLAWDYSPKFKKFMIHVLNVPAFLGIRFHSGVTDEHTEGCVLGGKDYRKVNGVYQLVGSKIAREETEKVLVPLIKAGGVYLNILRTYA